jgi:hypothetical protein
MFILGHSGAVCAAPFTTSKMGHRHISATILGIIWPPRSPDLTPLDFFLWGYVINTVYQDKINNLQHLKAHIRDAVATVAPNMPTLKLNEKVIHSENKMLIVSFVMM